MTDFSLLDFRPSYLNDSMMILYTREQIAGSCHSVVRPSSYAPTRHQYLSVYFLSVSVWARKNNGLVEAVGAAHPAGQPLPSWLEAQKAIIK